MTNLNNILGEFTMSAMEMDEIDADMRKTLEKAERPLGAEIIEFIREHLERERAHFASCRMMLRAIKNQKADQKPRFDQIRRFLENRLELEDERMGYWTQILKTVLI